MHVPFLRTVGNPGTVIYRLQPPVLRRMLTAVFVLALLHQMVKPLLWEDSASLSGWTPMDVTSC